MTPLLGGLRGRSRRLLGMEKAPYDPPATVRAAGPGTWYQACLYAWGTMLAALLSCSMFIADPRLTVEIGLLIVAAFPVAYLLHYSTFPRAAMNYLTFFAAVLLGALRFGPTFIAYQQQPPEDVFLALRLLITVFLWVMAFRAFAMRTISELVQTILPAGSIVLLSLVVVQHYTALVGMALLIWGTLALLALERRLAAGPTYAEVRGLRLSRVRRWSGNFYSWPALYVLAVLVAIGVGYYTARAELSSDKIEDMRMYLARALVRHLVMADYTPPAALWLPSIQPPEGRQVVMEVKCERPTYWRTTSYDTYTDRTWSRRMPRRRISEEAQEGGWRIPLQDSGVSSSAVQTRAQFTTHVSFGAALPTMLYPVWLDAEVDGLLYSPDGTIAPHSHAMAGRTYEVVALVPPPLPSGLLEYPADPQELKTCLRLTASLSPRVAQLARELTGEAASDFEKARAIELHLAYNYTYDLRAPRPWPQEMVEHFLFHTKRGYCYHFATAMVLLCRSVGLPARLAIGFTHGEVRDAVEDLYVVRAEDAHAWPEVYLTDGGWLPFEPTPGAREDEAQTATDVWREMWAEMKLQMGLTAGVVSRRLPSVVAIVGALLIMVVSARSYLDWRRRRPPVRANTREQIVWAYQQMRRLLGSHGAPDHPQVPAGEFVERLPSRLDHIREIAHQISGEYLAARFGRSLPGRAAADRVLAALGALREGLRRGPR